jgi:hypothetical protein
LEPLRTGVALPPLKALRPDTRTGFDKKRADDFIYGRHSRASLSHRSSKNEHELDGSVPVNASEQTRCDACVVHQERLIAHGLRIAVWHHRRDDGKLPRRTVRTLHTDARRTLRTNVTLRTVVTLRTLVTRCTTWTSASRCTELALCAGLPTITTDTRFTTIAANTDATLCTLRTLSALHTAWTIASLRTGRTIITFLARRTAKSYAIPSTFPNDGLAAFTLCTVGSRFPNDTLEASIALVPLLTLCALTTRSALVALRSMLTRFALPSFRGRLRMNCRDLAAHHSTSL